MSLSPKLSTTFNDTKLRTPGDVCDISGMCSVCSDQCTGLCEIGLSAVRGKEVVFPYKTTSNQFASEKKYPFDFSHFNINGRVFGAMGAAEDSELTNVHLADTACEIGDQYKIKLKAPIILPAMAKLNWRDYYSGAAMAGIMVVIGESAVSKDPDLRYDEDGKVIHAPVIGEMIDCFRRFDKGYGDIVLQVNADDIAAKSAEYALKNFDLKTVELKFGQAAKGIQHVALIYDYDKAVELKKKGRLVFPDPLDPTVKEAFGRGEVPEFMQCGRLPMWNEKILEELIQSYRDLGAENILFKMAGYDRQDVHRVLEIASKNKVALVTFDGAGGGTGHSPCKMMNEWSYPTIELEKIVNSYMNRLRDEGQWMPSIAIAGGIAMEDTVFKALALGAPNIRMVGIGRAAMAAAISGKNLGEQIQKGNIPKRYLEFGNQTDMIFKDAKYIKSIYPKVTEPISYGAIGLFSYIQRIIFGMKLFMTLNRKFKLELIDQSDIIPLTPEAKAYLTD